MARYKRKSPKKLAGKLRDVRARLGLTQQQVADALGTDASSISRFERGIRDPSLLELLGYSRLTGVGMEAFVDDKMQLSKKSHK
jgi:transcriptional regulator with XRE-family HTH domain